MMQNPLQGIPQRVWIAGILSGFLLIGLCAVVPERLQAVTVYIGVALTLINTTAVLLSSAGNAWLEWRGVFPVLAMIVGAVLIVAATVRSHLENNKNTAIPLNPVSAPMSARREPETTPVAPTSQDESPASQSAGKPLAPLLMEIQTILNLRVRPALSELAQSLSREPQPDILRSELKPTSDKLAEAQSSLERITSQNQDLSEQLATVMGDPRTLAELNGALRGFVESLGSTGTPAAEVSGSIASEVPRLKTLESDTMKWVAASNRRIVEQRSRGPSR